MWGFRKLINSVSVVLLPRKVGCWWVWSWVFTVWREEARGCSCPLLCWQMQECCQLDGMEAKLESAAENSLGIPAEVCSPTELTPCPAQKTEGAAGATEVGTELGMAELSWAEQNPGLGSITPLLPAVPWCGSGFFLPGEGLGGSNSWWEYWEQQLQLL